MTRKMPSQKSDATQNYGILTDADYLCVLCGAPLRTDLDAPRETAWFRTLDHGRKPAHVACLDAGKAQLVMPGAA